MASFCMCRSKNKTVLSSFFFQLMQSSFRLSASHVKHGSKGEFLPDPYDCPAIRYVAVRLLNFIDRNLERDDSVPKVIALSCYHCKSQPGDNRNCEEPSLSRLEANKRSCPSDEKCVKIEQVTGDLTRRSVIRDCYKTRSMMKDGYYTGLDYYGSKLDGNVLICDKNYCNSQSVLKSIGIVNVVFMMMAVIAGRIPI